MAATDPFSPMFSADFGTSGWITTVPTHTTAFMATRLTAGATYDFQVYAIDGAGLAGPPSPILTLTTKA